MNFRWSDEHSFAVEFECECENDFYPAALAALADARTHRIKHYHEHGQQKMFFPPLYLHVYGVQGLWLNPCRSDEQPVRADERIETSIDNVLAGDGFWLSADQYIIWARCERTYTWSVEFEHFCGAVGNAIQEMDHKIKNEKTAVEQFEKMVTLNQ